MLRGINAQKLFLSPLGAKSFLNVATAQSSMLISGPNIVLLLLVSATEVSQRMRFAKSLHVKIDSS